MAYIRPKYRKYYAIFIVIIAFILLGLALIRYYFPHYSEIYPLEKIGNINLLILLLFFLPLIFNELKYDYKTKRLSNRLSKKDILSIFFYLSIILIFVIFSIAKIFGYLSIFPLDIPIHSSPTSIISFKRLVTILFSILLLYVISNLIIIDLFTRTFYHKKKYDKLITFYKLFRRMDINEFEKNSLKFVFRKFILSFLFSKESLIFISSAFLMLRKNEEIMELSKYTTIKYHEDSFFHVNKAQALLNMGKNSEALKSIEIAKQLDPLSTIASTLEGIILLNLNKLKESFISFDESIRISKLLEQIESNNPYISFNIAFCHYLKNDYTLAIDYCNRAIQLEKNYVEAYICRGKSLSATNKHFQALEDFNKSIELEPKEPYNYLCLAKVYSLIGNGSLAIDYCNKAINLDQEYPLTYFYKGMVYYKTEEYTKAIDNFDKAIKLNSNDSASFFYRGRTHFAKNDFNLALNDYNKAIEMDPEYNLALLAVAEIRSFDDAKEAIKICDSVFEKDNLSSDDLIYLLDIYCQLGEDKILERVFRRASEITKDPETLKILNSIYQDIKNNQVEAINEKFKEIEIQNGLLTKDNKDYRGKIFWQKEEYNKLREKAILLENQLNELKEYLEKNLEFMNNDVSKIKISLGVALEKINLIDEEIELINEASKDIYTKMEEYSKSLKERYPNEFEEKKRELRKRLEMEDG